MTEAQDKPQPKRQSPRCEHQMEDEPNCQPAFRNHYACTCGNEWDSEWSCMCDDECSECGTIMTCEDAEEIAPCACKYLGN